MRFFRELTLRSRWAIILLALATLSIVITGSVPAWRSSVLAAVGWTLVAEDPPAKADIVVISTNGLQSGILEAADLVHSGFASRVAIFRPPVSRAASELERRGVKTSSEKEAAIQFLHELGVAEVAIIPSTVGTVDEGDVLKRWCIANNIHSILFVSVPDHSRRTRRVLNRALGQYGVKVMVRYTRFSEYDPNAWWRTRGGQRVQLVETEKLLLDLLRHPL